jgi:hypothetical protein
MTRNGFAVTKRYERLDHKISKVVVESAKMSMTLLRLRQKCVIFLNRRAGPYVEDGQVFVANEL